jgi:hypothetical protein
MPCICILLSNEEETEMGLGDYGEDEDGNILQYTEELEVVSTIGADYSFPYIKLTNLPVVEVTQITNTTLNTDIEPDEYYVEDPDKGIIAIASGVAEHGDTVTVTYTYRQTVIEQMEVLYESNYRLEVWATNGDLTVELYHILKWALLSGRNALIENYDIFRQRLSGADFEPVTNMFPDFVYRRALSFWCQFSVTTPDEESEFITGVVTTQTDYVGEFGGE